VVRRPHAVNGRGTDPADRTNASEPAVMRRTNQDVVDPGTRLHRRDNVRIRAVPGPRHGTNGRVSPRINEYEALSRRSGLVATEQAHFVRVRLGVQVTEHNNRMILTGVSRQRLDEGPYLVTARCRVPRRRRELGGRQRHSTARRVHAAEQRGPARIAGTTRWEAEFRQFADRPTRQDRVGDVGSTPRLAGVPSLGLWRSHPNRMQAQCAGELISQVAIAVYPDLLQAADVRAGSAENATNRRQSLLPFTESPPEVPGRDLHLVWLRPSSSGTAGFVMMQL
jgi:hypothetical protein